MKIRITRLLLAISFLGFLSCQQEDRSTSSSSESIPLALRLVAASGNEIPESDTLRFVVTVGSKTTDTLVDWDQHELDLGSVKEGDEIQWQAMAWKWDSSKTVRRVVWASKKLTATARSSGNSQAFTLETPVETSTFEAPELVPEGFAIGKADSISLAYKDSAFKFTFKVSAGVDTVRIDDTLAKAEDGVYSKTYTVAPGKSLLVKVWIKDTLGSISILSYTLSRAIKTTVDTSLDIAFVVPGDTTLSYADSNLSVRIMTTSKLHLDTVRVGSTVLAKDGDDSTLWTGTVEGIKVGTDTLRAIAVAGTRRDTAKRAVTRLEEGKIDSSLKVEFEVPGDTTLSYADSNLSVRIKTTSKLRIDTVRVGSKVLMKDGDDSTLWTGTVGGIEVGTDTLRAIAVAGTRRDTAKRMVIRLEKDQIDTSLKVAFEVSGDTTLSYEDSSLAVRVRTTTKLHIDTVRVGSKVLTKDGDDSTLWTGTVEGIKVGTDTLRAIVVAGIRRDTARRAVTRKAKDAVDSSIAVKFRTPTARNIRFEDSSLQVEVEVLSKQAVVLVLVGKDTLAPSGSNDTLWVGSVRGLKVGDNTLKAIATTSLRKDSASFVVTRAQDSTIRTSFLSPMGDTTLPSNASSLLVKVKVVTKLPVASVLVVGKESLTRPNDKDSVWSGTVKDLFEGENSLVFVVSAGEKTDTVRKSVKRAGDSTVSVDFVVPKNDMELSNGDSTLPVKVKVTTKLNVTSVKIGDVDLSKDDKEPEHWTGTVKDLNVGENTLRAIATAGSKTGAAERIVTRRARIDAPTFSLGAGRNVGTQSVSIGAVSFATVEYSTDDSSWSRYSSAVSIPKTQTLRARAFKTGTDTSYASARYVIVAEPPTFDPSSGTTTDSVRVAISSVRSGATIFYSTDSAQWILYVSPVFFDSNVTLYAMAWVRGLDTSAVSKTSFKVAAAKPTITPNGNTSAVVDSQVVTLATKTKDGSFVWSTDNVNWKASSGKVVLKANATLFAKTVRRGMDTSAASQASFRVKVAAPKIDPNGGTFPAYKEVVLTSSTDGASFLWSTNKTSWKSSTGTIQLSENDTVYAKAWKLGMDTSEVGKTYCLIKVAKPVLETGDLQFTAPQGVTFETTTPSATLQWSTDSGNWSTYTSAGVTLDTSVTLYVKATKADMVPSDVLKLTFADTAFGYPLKNRPRPSAGCGLDSGVASGTHVMTVQGASRTYVLKLPTSYNTSKPHRLVFGMHAMGGSATSVANDKWFNLQQLDTENTTIWVAPQGDASGQWTLGVKDHEFFDSLLIKLKQEVCVDTTRVFSVGFSFGGMFTHSLARSHQNVFRGVVMYGTVEYNIWSPPDIPLPLAWMGTVGHKDGTTSANGTTGTNGGRGARNRFVGYNGGNSSFIAPEVDTATKGHLCYDYTDVKTRHPVKWCTFYGGHEDRPKDPGATTSWIPETTWNFIKQF